MLTVSMRHDFGSFAITVDFTAPKGVTALFGASGAGKTTVVNAVAGLFHPDHGRIEAEGTPLYDTDQHINLPPRRRRVGYVFQEPRLFPHLSVRSNLLYGARFAPRDATGPDFDTVIAMLGIGALLDRRPGALSGGEKSRVSLGRALLSKPRMLLMDEPLAALDAPRREEILPFLESLRDAGMPVLLVSHSMAEVARLASTVVLLERGRVTAAGPTAAILSDPALAPRFGGAEAGTILTARNAGPDADGLIRLETAGGPLWVTEAPDAPHLLLRIHASDVIVSRARPEGLSALNILAGTIRRIETAPNGRAFVQIAVGAEAILAAVTQRSVAALGLEPGVKCYAVVKSVAVSRDDLARL